MASFDKKMKRELRRRDGGIAKAQLAYDKVTGMVSTESENLKCDLQSAKADLKEKLDPESMIHKSPWAAVFGALGVGTGLGLMLKRALTRKRRRYLRTAAVQMPAQRVVIEVDHKHVSMPAPAPVNGASARTGEKETKEKNSASHGWIHGLTAVAASLPGILDRAQKIVEELKHYMAKKDEIENGEEEEQRAEHEAAPPPAAGGPASYAQPAPKPGQPFVPPHVSQQKPQGVSQQSGAAPVPGAQPQDKAKFPKTMSRRQAPPPPEV